MEDTLKVFRFDLSVNVEAYDYDEAMEVLEFRIQSGQIAWRDLFILEITEVG